MASKLSEALPKFTAETLKLAAKQSQRCHIVSDRLRSAIDNYLREQDCLNMSMRQKVLSLSRSLDGIKEANLLLPSKKSKDLVDDPLKAIEHKRWKLATAYGDAGLKYHEDQAIAYVAARMPAVYSALYRVLSEVKRRIPDFAPAKVLDFGAGTGSALWAMMEVWPGSLQKMNLVEPSQSMQRAGLGLIKDIPELPRIESYDTLQVLSKTINRKKSGRKHDLVIASYVLGEIPSLEDRITLVRQLWDLTDDILVLVEPGTPQGSKIISQMRSHILWLEKRKTRKLQTAAKKHNKCPKAPMKLNTGAFVVAPCPHDGPCPLVNTDKYCHFVQRLERTPSQRLYKRSKDGPLRGFEDEKFSYVAFRRGTRPRESWPLDGMKFETLKEMKASRIPENLEIDAESQFDSEGNDGDYQEEADDSTSDDLNLSEETGATIENENVAEDREDEDEATTASNDLNLSEETGATIENENVAEDDGEDEEEAPRADLGSGWGRIIYMPLKRGKMVGLDICRATNTEGTKGSFDRVVITQSKNPKLHHQAKRSMWGDLWPLRNDGNSKYFM